MNTKHTILGHNIEPFHIKLKRKRRHHSFDHINKKVDNRTFLDTIVNDLENAKTQIKARELKKKFSQTINRELKKNVFDETKKMLREKKDKFQYIKRLNRNSQHPVLLFEEVEGKNEDLRMDRPFVSRKQIGMHKKTQLYFELNKLPFSPRKQRIRSFESLTVEERGKVKSMGKKVKRQTDGIEPWQIHDQHY